MVWKKKNNSTKPRRRSLDPNDLLSNTAHWPPLSANKAEQRNLAAADWMEKILKKNKVDKGRSVENFVDENSLEADKKDFQDNDSQFNMYELMTPESFDEFEIATSDSSEQDFQVHLPRVASLPNGIGSKIKKPTQVKPSKSPEKSSKSPEKRYFTMFF